MRNRIALLSLVVACVLLGVGPAAAVAGEVVNSGIPFVADGKVVAKNADQIVVRTDDHGHRIAFAIDRSTVLPEELVIGRHVHVVYHPMGSTGQTADNVSVTPAMRASR
jgi:hypothetical protein